MSDKETRTVSLDVENDEWLSDQNNASAVVNDLVEQARKTGDYGTAAVQLQIRQKERERKNVQQREENLKEDLEELYALKRQMNKQEDAELDEAQNALENVPKEPTNPAVENWAEKLGMEPQELLDKIE